MIFQVNKGRKGRVWWERWQCGLGMKKKVERKKIGWWGEKIWWQREKRKRQDGREKREIVGRWRERVVLKRIINNIRG